MAYINFPKQRDLSPSAFKLYVYFLHQVQTRNQAVFTLSLAQLGEDSGLQAFRPWTYSHGRDGQVRRAVLELIEQGLIQKHGQRGRKPNPYRVLENPDHTPPTPNERTRSCHPDST